LRASIRPGAGQYNPTGSAPICGGLPGQLCTATDGLDRVTAFSYDSGGNLLTVTPPAGGALKATSITYDSAQRVQTTTDGNGVVTSYRYDSMNRPVEVRVGGTDCTGAALCTTVTYGSNGDVVTRQDPAGTTTYTYDKLNRVVSKRFQGSGQDTTSTMTYDLVGNLESFTDPNGTVRYGYNAAYELVSLAEPGGSCSGTIVGCTTFSYDANGVRTQMLYPGGTKVEYLNVDASSRPLRYRATNTAGATLMDFTYSYKTAAGADSGLVQTRTDAVAAGAVQRYSYDGLNQLTRAVESVGGATTAAWAYCYDAAGNRTFDSTSTATSVLCPGQAGGPAPTYTHDATNALTGLAGQPAGVFTYDGNGAELSGVGITTRTGAQWNALGQLTGLSTNGTAHNYTYAGIGNSRRLSADGATFPNTALSTTAQTGDNAHSVIREPNGSLIALRSGGESFYFIADRQGSTIALVNSSGTAHNTYSYDPYGQSRSKNETVFNPWQYIGGYLDAGGLYHLGARYYDPALGRFTQLDPSGQNAHYTYAGNNPVNASDPSGLAFQWDTYGSGSGYGANIGVYTGGSAAKGSGGVMLASRSAGCSKNPTADGWTAKHSSGIVTLVGFDDWMEDAWNWVKRNGDEIKGYAKKAGKWALRAFPGAFAVQCSITTAWEMSKGNDPLWQRVGNSAVGCVT
jgi:RHS repeat-associated protein